MKRLLVAGLASALLTACSDGPSGPSLPTSLSITAKEQFVVIGDTVRIPIDAGGGSADAVEWESLNPQIATVQNGRVTGVTRGSARVVARAGGLADTATVGVLRNQFNTSSDDFCENPQWATVRIAAVGEHVIILADTTVTAAVYSSSDYRNFARRFDETIRPTVTEAFGEPLGLHGVDRFIVLFTGDVNRMTDDPEEGFVGGFVWARDIFPRTQRVVRGVSFPACAGSNEAEMTYMAIPDPAWPKDIRDYIRRTTLATIAHEFQHAINASRRIFLHDMPPEELWLNEGMSHVAEELMFYRASGLEPRQALDMTALRSSQARLDAVNAYQIGNLINLGLYMAASEDESPLTTGEDGVGTESRGAAWNLLRYSADRRGSSPLQFWFNLLNSPVEGTENLQRAIGEELLPWMRDWAVSLYASSIGWTADTRFRQQSWHLGSVLPELFDGFPLQPELLPNGAVTQKAIAAGSAAYLRFAVGAGQVGEVTVGVAGTEASGSCRESGATQTLGLRGVYTGPAATVANLCFSGGDNGSEYVVIPFHASLTPGANLLVDLRGNGIGVAAPLAASRSSLREAVVFDAARSLGRAPTRSAARSRHLQMRIREREELARRLPQRIRPQRSISVSTPAEPLMVSVIRTR